MQAFFVSLSSVGIAEMGDRTQLLALILAARFRRPWPITAGIVIATLANHAVAELIGHWFGRWLQANRQNHADSRLDGLEPHEPHLP